MMTTAPNPMKWLRRWLYGTRVPDELAGASEELELAARDLRHNLQPYLAQPDPLAALMTDIFNKRQLQRSDIEIRNSQNGRF